jgi:hypothetical protein
MRDDNVFERDDIALSLVVNGRAAVSAELPLLSKMRTKHPRVDSDPCIVSPGS